MSARGFDCEVFAWGDARVVKLFDCSTPASRVDEQFRIAKAVHAAGLKAPAAFEILQIDDRRGIVYERIDGRSLFDDVQSKPWTLFAAAKRMAELHARIHEAKAPSEWPTWKHRIRKKIEANASLSERDRRRAAESLAALPDGDAVCHGDIHPANILCTADGVMAVDWGGATRGHPLGDVAWTVRLMEQAQLPTWAPRPMHWLLKLSRRSLLRTYLARYFSLRPGVVEELRPWKAVLEFLPRLG